MQITSRFTVAVHILTAVDYFKDTETVTSGFLAGSVGVNPVIIRNVMGSLKDAGIISISQGKSGISLARDLSEITFYDVYRAVDCVDDAGLFHFHEHPNPQCPVGRNIHSAMEGRLLEVQESMEEQMKKITIADIVSDVKEKIQHSGKGQKVS